MSKITSIMALLTFLWACKEVKTPHQDGQRFFIGSYSAPEGSDIFEAYLSDDGVITGLKGIARSGNPSYLAMYPGSDTLYAVNEHFDKKGELSVYLLTSDTLTIISRRGSEGMYPCYLDLSSSSSGFLANYGGSIAKFNYKYSDQMISKEHAGSGPHPRQDAAHPHMSVFWKERNLIIVPDLGTDEIYFYTADSLREVFKVHVDSASGPRHVAIYDKDRFFVVNELANTVTDFQWKSGAPQPEATGSYSTLPDDFSGESYAAAIVLHPDQRHLYVSNRGHESIAVFEIEENGTLDLLENQTEGIQWPRGMALSNGGRFLVVGNQKGNTIKVFEVNSKNGILRPVGTEISVHAPTHIFFPSN